MSYQSHKYLITNAWQRIIDAIAARLDAIETRSRVFLFTGVFCSPNAAAIVLIKQPSRQPGQRFNLMPYHNKSRDKDRRFNRDMVRR
jgi:hypothetical protein